MTRQPAGRQKRRGGGEQRIDREGPAPAGEGPEQRGEKKEKRDERVLAAQAPRMHEQCGRGQQKDDRPERGGGLRSGPRESPGSLQKFRSAGEREPEHQRDRAESLVPVRCESERAEHGPDGHRDEEEHNGLPDQPHAHPMIRVEHLDCREKLLIDEADLPPFAGGLADGFEPLGGGHLSAHGSPSCGDGRRRRARGQEGSIVRRGGTRPPGRERPRRSAAAGPGAPR